MQAPSSLSEDSDKPIEPKEAMFHERLADSSGESEEANSHLKDDQKEAKHCFAIVEIAGKQMWVKVGDVLHIDRLEHDIETKVVFPEVMLLVDGEQIRVGQPYVPDVGVAVTVTRHHRGKKVKVFKRRKRKGFHKMIGFRHALSSIRIDHIGDVHTPKAG